MRLKTRLEHTPPALRKTLEADVKRLERRRARQITRLVAALRAHPDLARRFDLVLSVPAIGQRTALSIVVRLPEIEQVNREQAAALAGLAPFVHASGQFEGQTHIGGGRARLRRCLHMAALPGAHRWNPALIALYRRMTAAGKSPKGALVACARKLLIFAVSVVQRGTPWQLKQGNAVGRVTVVDLNGRRGSLHVNRHLLAHHAVPQRGVTAADAQMER